MRRAYLWAFYMDSAQISFCFAGCGRYISRLTYTPTHVISKMHGGKDTFDNIVPTCTMCNSNIGTDNLFKYASHRGYEAKRPCIRKRGFMVFKYDDDVDIDKLDYDNVVRLAIYNNISLKIPMEDMKDSLKELMGFNIPKTSDTKKCCIIL